jgi:SPOR domain
MRVAAVTIGIVLLCSPMAAQPVDPTAAVLQSHKVYDDCVYESVAAQLHQMPIGARRNADFNALGEQGFLACATEERVLGMTLAVHNVSPQVVQVALLGIRAQVKRTLRDIAANPEKYGAPQKAQAAKSPIGETGGFLVQVASQPSEIEAKASYHALQDEFPALLGSRGPVIKRADLGDKGVYYRAMVGPFGTPDEASQFCGSLITAGGRCVVQRN